MLPSSCLIKAPNCELLQRTFTHHVSDLETKDLPPPPVLGSLTGLCQKVTDNRRGRPRQRLPVLPQEDAHSSRPHREPRETCSGQTPPQSLPRTRMRMRLLSHRPSSWGGVPERVSAARETIIWQKGGQLTATVPKAINHIWISNKIKCFLPEEFLL